MPFIFFLLTFLAATLHASPFDHTPLPLPAPKTIPAQVIPAPATPIVPVQTSRTNVIQTTFVSHTGPAVQGFQLGITHLRAMGYAPILGKRVGLLTHAAACDENGTPTVEVLRNAPGVKLAALYAPEHGLNGQAKAEEKIDDERYQGIPVHSLYGDTRKPTSKMLDGIDVMVIDLQDVGVRSYTYISAMKYTLEACFEHKIPVIVLDRPNPLGGLKVDGPLLDEHFKSYVGAFHIPYVHGLTMGELALLAQDELKPLTGSLSVMRMTGWHRNMMWSDTGLKWAPTSPAVPTLGAAVGYACTGLGAQLGGFHHGIGTEFPFRFLSHPKLSAVELKTRLDREHLPGFAFETMKIKAGAEGEDKEGVYVKITYWPEASPVTLSLVMLEISQELNGPAPFVDASVSTQELFCKHWGRAEPLQTLRSTHRLRAVRLGNYWEREAQRWQGTVARKYWLY